MFILSCCLKNKASIAANLEVIIVKFGKMPHNIFILKTDAHSWNIDTVTLDFISSSVINKLGLKVDCLSKAGALQSVPPLIYSFVRHLHSIIIIRIT